MNIAIPGVSSGFGSPGYGGSNYLNTFNSWGIGGSPDVPSIAPGEGMTQLVNPGVYANPNPPLSPDGGGMFASLGGFMPDFLTDGSIFNKRLASGEQVQGWGGPTLGALSALGSGFLAMKQYGLAKDQFDFQKQAFNQNFAAQRQATNSQLEDRQRARVASNASAYQSVGDYMAKNGIK